MIDISPEKVARIIVRAREYEAKTAPWDDDSRDERENEIDSILASVSNDPIAAELKSYIDDLNDDEKASLVALLWIGRGSFDVEDLDEALSTARAERINATSAYVMGVPLLPDYLEEALEKLGYSVSELEDDVM